MLVLVLVLALLVLAGLAGCSGDGPPRATSPTTSSSTAAPTTTTTAAPPARGIALSQVVVLDQPVAMAVRANDPALYFAEKTGRVRKVEGGQVVGGPVIDVSGNLSVGGEQGLLGLAFAPDGSKAYVNYTDRQGDTHIAEHDMAAGPTALRDLLFVDQPFANHNGGNLIFGPDGFLYAGLGDGGSGNDPMNNAQNPNTPLGKMLRFDPVRNPGQKYEIWARGLRNPWRYSFDRATGDLWIGDVGQNQWEEIDVDRAPLDAGRNYGWPQREGRHALKSQTVPAGAVEPEFEYPLTGGACAVTGGYVYRGTALKTLLDGVYLFADYCAGALMGLRNGAAQDLHTHVDSPASFGEDAAGEVYVLSLRGPVLRIDPVF